MRKNKDNKDTTKEYKTLSYVLISFLSIAMLITGISYFNSLKGYNSNKSYTSVTNKILFNLNGGTGWTTRQALVKKGYSLPTVSDVAPTRKGYTFMGWFDNPNFLKGRQYYSKTGEAIRKYDRKDSVILYAGWKKDQVLYGKALSMFKKANNINEDPNIIVVKNNRLIGDLDFNVYYVYNTNITEKRYNNFITYINHTVNNVRNIDSKVLYHMYKNGTDLIYLGTDDSDNSCVQNDGHCSFAAYCNSLTRDVVVAYADFYLTDTYYQRSIIHELGHAFDFTLKYVLTEETASGITGLTSNQVLKGYTNSNGKFIPSSTLFPLFTGNRLSKINVYTWNYLAEKYAPILKSQIPDFSVYQTSDLAKSGLEFYAEIFRHYYWDESHRNAIKVVSPVVYEAFEKTVNYFN